MAPEKATCYLINITSSDVTHWLCCLVGNVGARIWKAVHGSALDTYNTVGHTQKQMMKIKSGEEIPFFFFFFYSTNSSFFKTWRQHYPQWKRPITGTVVSMRPHRFSLHTSKSAHNDLHLCAANTPASVIQFIQDVILYCGHWSFDPSSALWECWWMDAALSMEGPGTML